MMVTSVLASRSVTLSRTPAASRAALSLTVQTCVVPLDRVLAAGDAMDGASVAWILDYWVRKLGREPDPGEIEPLTRLWWEAGKDVTASQYLLAMRDLQAFRRTVARFFTEVDLWLTPTLSEPPIRTGEISGLSEDPEATMQRAGSFMGFPGWVANLTGAPAISVPLHWSPDGLPIGVHFMGRYGDEATLLRLASQLEQARPWAARTPVVPRATTQPVAA